MSGLCGSVIYYLYIQQFMFCKNYLFSCDIRNKEICHVKDSRPAWMNIFELDVQDHVVKLSDENIQVSDAGQDWLIFILLFFCEHLMKAAILYHDKGILKHKTFESCYTCKFCKALKHNERNSEVNRTWFISMSSDDCLSDNASHRDWTCFTWLDLSTWKQNWHCYLNSHLYIDTISIYIYFANIVCYNAELGLSRRQTG